MAEPSSFPKGLRVLAVDDDKVALHILQQMLLSCNYHVTVLERSNDALRAIREDPGRFDLVLCDVHMPEIDGFTLLQAIRSESDIPVVMMSSDDSFQLVIKSVINGACDYLVKPICTEQIRVIWQHVLRRRRNVPRIAINPTRIDDVEAKKPRIVWTTELHHKFIKAVHKLGADKAVPKKILECMQQMGVTDLTRANVASHLQKFRLYVRRINEESIEHSDFEQSSSLAQFRYGDNIGVVTSNSGQAYDDIDGGFSRNLGQPVQVMAPSNDCGHAGFGVPQSMHVFPQNTELGNLVAHHQQNNYCIDDD